MNLLTKNSIIISILFLMTSCSNDDEPKLEIITSEINLSTHKLATYSIRQNSNYLVVFESGLGDDHSIWDIKNISSKTNTKEDIISYDRASYGHSETGPSPRNIDRIGNELGSIVDQFANGRKVILVGHSLGGMIIRDYAIKNPTKIAGLLFIDPSHEHYNIPSQTTEDMLVDLFASNYGVAFGGTLEARELIEDSQYMSSLPNLPNIPVVVISSMKVDTEHSIADRQLWFDAHEMLQNGITDFTHRTTTNAGHYIMNDEPRLVIDSLNLLLSKLN